MRIKQKRAHQETQAKFRVDLEGPYHELECLEKRAKVLQSCMLGDKGA